MKMKKNSLFVFLMVVMMWLVPAVSDAARTRHYVYVFDCTSSMDRPENRMADGTTAWKAALNFLDREIRRLGEDDKVTIVPFHQDVTKPISFAGNEYDRKAVHKVLEEAKPNSIHTGICQAWDEALKQLDPADDNYLILLTDGSENVVKSDPMGTLCKKLQGWEKFPRDHAFYVMLTKEAKTIQDRLANDKPENLHFIDATDEIPTFGAVATGTASDDGAIRVNAWELLAGCDVPLEGSLKISHPLHITSYDQHVDAHIVDGQTVDGYCSMRLKSRYGDDYARLSAALDSAEYSFEVAFEATKGIDIINTLTVIVINKPERALSSNQLREENPMIGKTKHYDRFLFWRASKPGMVSYDIKPEFSPGALEQGSSAVMRVVAAQGEPTDFVVKVNGKEAPDGRFMFAAADTATVHLEIVFNSDAKTGKRKFEIVAEQATNLDRICSTHPANAFKYGFSAKYRKVWNPLAWILLILLIAIVAGLLLWFLVARPSIYSYFKVATLTVSEPYFSQKRIKGARRVVFTNSAKKQSALNRLFTGRIIYLVHPVWTSDLVLEPNKRAVRMRNNPAYAVDPFAVAMQRHVEYKITNNKTKDKIVITFN